MGAAIAVACTMPALASAAGAARSRVPATIDGARRTTLLGTRHPLARPERDGGPVPPEHFLRGMSLVLAPSAAQQADLAALLERQQDPSSPDYRRWLTPEEYAERFGVTAGDVARISSWLRSQGLQVEWTSRGRTRIAFGGTAGQVAAAFGTELRRYAAPDGRGYLALATDVSVPTGLAAVVRGVANASDLRPRPRLLRPRTLSPQFTSSLSGNHFIAPGDFAAIYDVPSTADGSGQTIAVAGQTQISTADFDAFRAAAGLPAGHLVTVLAPGTGNSVVSTNDVDEANLDVEWSSAVAPGATIVYVYSGDATNASVFDAAHHAVDQVLAPVVSLSYGACEADWPSTELALMQAIAQQANAQGQTIVAASGDSGAADCDGAATSAATQGLAVDVPASLPEVTGIGGTQFAGDVTSPGTYWSATNGAGAGSALGYIPETVWNEAVASQTLGAGGGGVSKLFAKPSWQTGPGVPADGRRDVPDVSLNASPEHDGYLVCSAGSCVNGFRRADTTLDVVGGTSAGAPAFAGVLALVMQARGRGGLGNVNPTLYALAASAPGAFHRVTTGSNAVPCQAGSTDCPAAPPLQIGFGAGAAYSPAAGLGSVDVAQLIAAWPSAAGPSTSALTVSVAGAGTGTVTGSGVGCASGSTVGCTVQQPSGTTVTLLAAPAAGSTFVGWSGACSGAALRCQVTVTGATSVTAAFALEVPSSYDLVTAISGTGTGTITGGGLACTSGSTAGCAVQQTGGTTVTLVAAPSAGSTFAGWGGACSGTTPTCQVTVSAPTSITATFATVATVATVTKGAGGGCSQGLSGAEGLLVVAGLLARRGWRWRRCRGAD